MRRKISKLLLSSGLVVASSTLLVTSTIVGGTTKASADVTFAEAEGTKDNRSSDSLVTNPEVGEMHTTAFTKDDVTFESEKGGQKAEGIGLSMKNALRYATSKDDHDPPFNISDFQIGLAIGNGKKGCPYKKSSPGRKYLYTSAKNKIDLTESCDVSNPEAPNRYWFWFDINKQHSTSIEQYKKYLKASGNTAKIKALGGKSKIEVEDTWIKPKSGKEIAEGTVGSTWSTVGFYGTATAITTSKCTPAGEPKDKNSYNSMEKAALPYKIKRLKCYPSTEADSFYYKIGTAQERGNGTTYLADLYVIDIKDWYDKAYKNYHKETSSLYLQSVFQLNLANGQHSNVYTKLEPFWKATGDLGYSAACRKDFQYHYNYYIPLKKIKHETIIYRIGTDEKHQRVGNEKLVIDNEFGEGERYDKDDLPAHSVVKFKGIKTYTDKDGKKWYLKGIKVVDSKPKNGNYEEKTKARFFITDNVGSTSTAQITGTKNATSSLYSTKNGVGSGKNTAGGEFLYTSRKTVLHGNAEADDEDGTEWEIGDKIMVRGKRAGKFKNEFLPAGKKYTYQERKRLISGCPS